MKPIRRFLTIYKAYVISAALIGVALLMVFRHLQPFRNDSVSLRY
jgi:hypothetical protein